MFVITMFTESGVDRRKEMLGIFDEAASSLRCLKRVSFTVPDIQWSAHALEPWSYGPEFLSTVQSFLPQLKEKVQITINHPVFQQAVPTRTPDTRIDGGES